MEADMTTSTVSDELDTIEEIQASLLDQTKIIDSFLQENKPKMAGSEVYTLLDSLFTLFKSEMEINLTLRRKYSDISDSYDRLSARQARFLADLGSIFGCKIESVEDVRAAVGRMCNHKVLVRKELQNIEKQAILTEKKVESIQDLHLNQFDSQQRKLNTIQTSKEETETVLAESLKALEQRIKEIQLLKSEILDKNDVIEDQKAKIHKSMLKIAELEAKLDEKENQISRITSNHASQQQEELESIIKKLDDLKEKDTIKYSASTSTEEHLPLERLLRCAGMKSANKTKITMAKLFAQEIAKMRQKYESELDSQKTRQDALIHEFDIQFKDLRDSMQRMEYENERLRNVLRARSDSFNNQTTLLNDVKSILLTYTDHSSDEIVQKLKTRIF